MSFDYGSGIIGQKYLETSKHRVEVGTLGAGVQWEHPVY